MATSNCARSSVIVDLQCCACMYCSSAFMDAAKDSFARRSRGEIEDMAGMWTMLLRWGKAAGIRRCEGLARGGDLPRPCESSMIPAEFRVPL